MFVNTWNNGSYKESSTGYGVKISTTNREKFFDKSWKSVVVSISNPKNSIEIAIKDTFWTTCSELRSERIGKYIIENRLGKWEKGKPNKLLLFPQNDNRFVLMVSNPIELATWAEKSKSRYDGCVEIGTMIYCGKNSVVEVTKEQYRSLLDIYAGMTINIGTSRDKASTNSLGYWLQNNVTKTAIASYVGKILVQEGYVEKIEGSMIKFN